MIWLFLTMDPALHAAPAASPSELAQYLSGVQRRLCRRRAAVLLPGLSGHGARQDQRHSVLSGRRSRADRAAAREPVLCDYLRWRWRSPRNRRHFLLITHGRFRFRQIAPDRPTCWKLFPGAIRIPLRCGAQSGCSASAPLDDSGDSAFGQGTVHPDASARTYRRLF
jgi:hypothetical protein